MLPLKERWLINKERVVDELAIKSLSTVHLIQIKGIVRSIFAAGLDYRARSEGVGPGEVRLHRQSLPISHLDRSETSVVVTVAYAGINRDARRVLDRAPIERSEGRVHHGGPSVDRGHCGVEVAPQAPYLSSGEVTCGSIHSRASTNAGSAACTVSVSFFASYRGGAT